MRGAQAIRSARTRGVFVILAALAGVTAIAGQIAQEVRPRARDLGIAPGIGMPGPQNAITDVGGVAVGHVTIRAGEPAGRSGVTGVTAILPHGGNVFRDKVPGAVFIGNAFGKLAGSTQVQELGTIETPIIFTNTLSVGAALDGLARWTVAQPGNENVRSVNGLVGETNDGTLNDIRAFNVTSDHVRQAIASARGGTVEEGAVGAGAGTIAFGWKGGIGTSSRVVSEQGATWTVGVLVQTNFGGRLTMAGVPVWKEITTGSAGLVPPKPGDSEAKADGSCMIVVATDAPLDARNLERLAARAIFALARTGSTYSNGSGDFAIAFSTDRTNRVNATTGAQARTFLTTDGVSGLFEATLDATEEAVYNSLLKATTTTGNGRTIQALPIDKLRDILKKYGR